MRTRAWKSIEPATLAAPYLPSEPVRAEPSPEASQRFLLWVDGVGGYLICLGSRVTLGQAASEGNVEIPLYADVSRRHATLSRDTEGYLLEALRPVQVNGLLVDKALLRPGDRVTLGTCCQFLFRQPVPVSATAELELVSGHRLPVAVERVFLMADTLVLGPSPQSHVVMPDLAQPIILFRHKDGLGIRHAGNLAVDGQPCGERGTLGPASRATGDDFAFALEPLGTWIGRT